MCTLWKLWVCFPGVAVVIDIIHLLSYFYNQNKLIINEELKCWDCTYVKVSKSNISPNVVWEII
jgi:hypothetical protein